MDLGLWTADSIACLATSAGATADKKPAHTASLSVAHVDCASTAAAAHASSTVDEDDRAFAARSRGVPHAAVDAENDLRQSSEQGNVETMADAHPFAALETAAVFAAGPVDDDPQTPSPFEAAWRA